MLGCCGGSRGACFPGMQQAATTIINCPSFESPAGRLSGERTEEKWTPVRNPSKCRQSSSLRSSPVPALCSHILDIKNYNKNCGSYDQMLRVMKWSALHGVASSVDKSWSQLFQFAPQDLTVFTTLKLTILNNRAYENSFSNVFSLLNMLICPREFKATQDSVDINKQACVWRSLWGCRS